jgi:CBS domain-containing protein
MTRLIVGDVMTTDVVAVTPQTPFKRIAQLLAEHRIGAVPVVDAAHRPVGIVSEADLLLKTEFAQRPRRPPLVPALDRWRHRNAHAKAAGVRAEQVLAAPVVTVEARRPLIEAARIFRARGLRHAPVVDRWGKLIGMVSRADLLKPFSAGDDAIRLEILSEVVDARFGLPWDDVQVEVADGIVTLRGRIDDPDVADAVVDAVQTLPGVVRVVDLTSRG